MEKSVTLYAGRGHTMWPTRDEAVQSWRAHSLADLIQHSDTVWWRATTVEVVECPPDVSLKDVLKKDL